MVRKEILTVLMADGYPIDGKPKEKTEKMHPEIWKRYALFAIAILLAGIVAYFAFATQAPVKTEIGPPTEVKTPEVQPAENAVVNAATGAVVIESSPLLARWGPLMSIDNIPAEIKLHNYDNLYVTNFKIGNDGISGYLENRGTKDEHTIVSMTFVSSEGYMIADDVVMSSSDTTGGVAPGQKKYIEVSQNNAWGKNILKLKSNTKYFKFK